jgi:CubicO group peptidase (beta-lactamase class C family)
MRHGGPEDAILIRENKSPAQAYSQSMLKRATTLCLFLCAASARAGVNLDALTLLARGATQGQNVGSAVQGFDVRVLRDGVPIYHQAFGNWSLNQLANIDSSSKTLSGALLMSVTENSTQPVSLDTRLSDFIPAFNDEKQAITLRQAFSHMSGLPGNSTALANTGISLQQAAQLIAGQPLTNGPAGSKFAYGGASMQAAGAVVELAGGASWNTLFAQRIAGPLGLTQTRYTLASPGNPRIAGGIESTAGEVGVFMESLRRGGIAPSGARILSQRSVDAMLTQQAPVGVQIVNSPTDNARYGVGVWLEQGTNGELDALAAGARGFHSWIDFDERLVFVFGTDTTAFGNVEGLSDLMHTAITTALANPVRNGDATLSGRVDFDDLLALAANYNQSGRLWSQGDFTGDGHANFDDLLQLAANYNTSGPAGAQPLIAVPEPASIVAAMLAGAIVCRRSRVGPLSLRPQT